MSCLAGPIKGGWITYQAIDTNSYNVRIHLIKDCGGQNLTTPRLKLNFGQQSVEFATSLFSSRDITGLNPLCNDTSLCDGGSLNYGYQLETYQGRVDLDTFGACQYYISYSDTSSRTSFNGLGEQFYTYSTINRCQIQTANSLELIGPINILAHANSNQIHTLEVADSNAVFDSVSYTLVPSLKDSATSITYSTSFAYNVPFIYTGFPSVPINFDERTGNLRYSGGLGGQNGVLAYEIIGWVNQGGTMTEVSRIHIDHDIFLENLGNQPPKFYGITDLQACAGQKNCWRFSSDELDTGQSVSYELMNEPSGMTSVYTDTSSVSPEIEICWTPGISQSGQAPFVFTLRFFDDACPYLGSSENKISILVEGPVDSSFIPELVKHRICGGYKLVLDDTANSGAVYDWVYDNKTTYSDSLIIASQDTGWFFFDYGYSLGSCKLRLYDSVYIAPPAPLQLSFTGQAATTCSNVERYIVSHVQGGVQPYTYSWFDASTLDSVAIISDTTDYWLLRVTDSIGCIIQDSARVPIFPKFLTQSDTLRLCNQGGTGPFRLSTQMLYGDSSKLNFYWQGYGEGNGFITHIPLSDTLVALEVRDVFSCSQFDTLPIVRYLAPSPNAGLDISRCGADLIELKALDSLSTNSNQYLWIGYGNGKTISRQFDSSAQVILQYEDETGCLTFDTTEITINSIPDIYIGNDTSICQREKITLTAATNGGLAPYSYNWNFGLASGNTTSFTVTGTVLVVARVTDSNLCLNEDSILIVVKSLSQITLTNPPHLCEDSLAVFMSDFSSPQGGTWSGNGIRDQSSIYKFDPSIAGPGMHWLTYSYVNTFNQCVARDSFQANVEGLANIEFWATPPSGPSPLNVQFMNQSSGGIQNSFEWDFGDSTALNFTQNPTYTYTKSGVYPVRLRIIGNKCVSERTKSSFVFVDTFGLKVGGISDQVLSVYPNPAKSVLYVDLDDAGNFNWLKLYSVEGKELEVNWTHEGDRLKIDFSKLAKGSYTLVLGYKTGLARQARIVKD